MRRIAQSDGNGGLIIKKNVVFITAIFSFASLIWGTALTFSNQYKLEPYKVYIEEKLNNTDKKVDILEKRIESTECKLTDYVHDHDVITERVITTLNRIEKILDK